MRKNNIKRKTKFIFKNRLNKATMDCETWCELILEGKNNITK